ncbi:sensor histidine kinase [Paenibacillus radicis (ex Xue et al. 2023)]|uniref:Heme sensor protein HssS n=1 Tax=Paenibacillus radicis (ex Xue et al. 2023) TaxID=2972489 RepID=A0ABT1YPH7_9BACL|nr:HAMP domain-containing sensor histidine kinase [Paenibacillus radicis (ex Xue et al. 2023)]MCR8635078.1 HAMP domain-containing histidine kinase [Paenibacillus radicis (ex Xue et al. 2023)]
MIKTLYFRVVVIYLTAVIIGLFTSFFITIYIFGEQISNEVEEDIMTQSKEIAHVYSQLNVQEADVYLTSISVLLSYHISLFDGKGQLNQYGKMNANNFIPIQEQMVNQVHNGQKIFSGQIIHSDDGSNRKKLLVGIPFEKNNEKYALFIQPSGISKWESIIRRMLTTTLAIVLLVGSVIFFIAARYLVKPLRAMTAATRRISKGDFNFNWSWPKRRKDELGELARSFGEMASELKQIEQMRQDFVSNVSHEIQSPLTSISGFSKALRNKSIEEEDRSRYLEIIQTESERLSRLTENLLKLASLESEHHPFHPVTYDLDEQIRQVIVASEPQWSAKNLQLDLELPSIKICSDKDQLNQVWTNLLSNSIKFSPKNGTIHIKASLKTTNEIEITILDEGIGISVEDQERIFERFFKADRSRTMSQGGSGLGLAIANKIVRLHQGSIQVKSTLGKGAAFIVTLPGVM